MPANNFYRDIAPFYGRFFPLGEKKPRFFADLLRSEGAERVLDLACGPGELSRALACDGFSVTGIDGSPEFFASGQADCSGSGAACFCVALMEALPFAGRELFDAVICAGNSLPHLDDWAGIERTVADCARIVRMGGLFCVQAIDFSLVRKRGSITLPELEFVEGPGSTRIRLHRIYRIDDAGAAFTPELRIGDVFAHYRIPMYPLEYDQLWELLRGSGFAHAGTFSDFAQSPWEGTTPSYITLARRQR